MRVEQGPEWMSWVIPIVVTAIILLVRARRMRRTQPLKLERLWIVPAAYLVFAGIMMWTLPPHIRDIPWLALALAVGAGIGWWRGAMMRITVDAETHALNQQASPAALVFLLLIVVARSAMRSGMMGETSALHLSAAFVTDIFIIFALGLLTATRLEMFLRARRMLGDARASGQQAE